MMRLSYIKLKKILFKAVYGSGGEIILKSIEEQCGKLDPNLKKKCDEYAYDVLGSSKHAQHLYIYSAIRNEFIEGWIPQSYYFSEVLPKEKSEYAKLGDLNCLQSLMLGNNIFPDIAYSINSKLYTTDYKSLDFTEFINFVKAKNEKIVFKSDNSGRGTGIKVLPPIEISNNLISDLGEGVFQSYINQHPFFDEFVNKSVATIRLTTVINDTSDVSMVGAYLRIARNDDTHVKSNSAVKIPINFKTGELHLKGYTAKWKFIYKHPDSGVRFESKKIPNFEKCVNLSKVFHKKVPYVNCIGWDMIVGNNNEAIPIEWNGYNNDIMFTEATMGPCFTEMNWKQLWKN